MQERRIVLITGCSRGIGLATAVAFARRGDLVVATLRNPAASPQLREQLAAVSQDAEIVALDVSDDDAVTAVVADVIARHGRIDVLVNNAGIGHKGTLEELSLDDIRKSMDVNFYGSVRTMMAVLPAMRERGSGNIINVSSLAGQFGQPFNDAYCASKHALEGLSESLCPIARRFGVHVTVLEPGLVLGEFFDHSTEGSRRVPDGPYTAMRAAFDDIMTATRDNAATCEEIADAIVAVADNPNPPARTQSPEWIKKLVGSKLKDLDGERVVGLTSKWLG